MLLSIIIPVYNAQNYLRECLSSFIDDLDERCEVILIDDGSTDGSDSICDEYKGKYDFIQVFHTKNNGVSSARNIGIEKASGEYIIFVDADDYFVKGGFKKLVGNIDGSDILFFPFLREGRDGKIEIFQYSLSGKSVDNITALLAAFHDGGTAPWSKLFKRKLILLNNVIFEPSMKINEDVLFCTEAMLAAKTVTFKTEPFYCYRYSDQGASKKHKVEYYDNYYVIYNKQYEYLTEYGTTEDIELLNNIFLKRIVLTTANLLNNGMSKQEINIVLLRNKLYNKIIQTKFDTYSSKLLQLLLAKGWYFALKIICNLNKK